MAETEPRYMVIRESSLREVKEQVDHFIGLGRKTGAAGEN